jgi:hypothetical protein
MAAWGDTLVRPLLKLTPIFDTGRPAWFHRSMSRPPVSKVQVKGGGQERPPHMALAHSPYWLELPRSQPYNDRAAILGIVGVGRVEGTWVREESCLSSSQ